MMDPHIDDNLLGACADAELTGPDRLAAERCIDRDPAAAATVEAVRQLNKAGRRCIQNNCPPVPAQLRRRIEALPGERRIRQTRRLTWLAASAVVLLAIGLSIRLGSSSPPPPGASITVFNVSASAAPLSPSLITAVRGKHSHCSALANHFGDPEFPRNLKALPDSLCKYLGCTARCPNLSSLGFVFDGAERCQIPGGKTVHLLYRSKTNPANVLSLFIQPNTAQLPIDKHRLYTASTPDHGHPMLVWRTDSLVYYLIGNAQRPVGEAAHIMGVAAK